MGLVQHLSNREDLNEIAKIVILQPSRIGFKAVEVPESTSRALDLADIDELVDRYKNGESVRQLASAFEIHRHTVSAHLERNGVPRRKPVRQLTDSQCIQVADSYRSGKSLTDVGSQFGVHAKTVSNELRKLGVTIRPQGKNYR